MDSVTPGVAEGFHLLGLAGDVARIPVLDVPARCRPLKVAVELDPIRWIKVDALHLASQPFALGKTRHDLQGVPQDHAVGPMLIVLIELGLGIPIGDPIEIIKQRQLGVLHLTRGLLVRYLGTLPIARHADQIVDEHLRMDLLLDVQRRCMDDQIRPVLLVFATPDQLRVQVRVPRILHRHRRLLIVADHRSVLDRRNVLPLVVGVPNRIDGFDGLFVGGLLRHGGEV